METKRCPWCDTTKPKTGFYKDAARYDGVCYLCKVCWGLKRRKMYKKHREKYKEIGKKWYAEHKDEMHKKGRKWYHDNKERMHVYWKVRKALMHGTLKKGACEVCGEEKVQAHHDDYSKPLDVRWLCVHHHQQHHAKQNYPNIPDFE